MQTDYLIICLFKRVGRDDDPLACLDSKMHVRGLEKLMVADASAMPDIVGANTNATCVALGEKAAEIIFKESLDR